jgi:hypothetical protein
VQTIVYPLLSLLYLSPLFLLFDGLIDLGIFLLALAFALILTGPTIPPREAQFFGKVIWPALAFAAFPAAFMIFQILPLPMFAHPAWQSTASALASPVSGSISVDKGATLLAFCRFSALCAAVFLSAAGGVNRGRAERILIAALSAATAVAALHTLAKPGSFPIGASAARSELHEAGDIVFIACFGLILSLAFAGLAYENVEVRRPKEQRKPSRRIPKWSFGLVSAIICVLALWRSWSGPPAVAVCAGLITVGLVVVARRLGLLVGGALAATALIVGLVLVAHSVGRTDLDITLRFAAGDTAKLETLQRMVQDEPTFGTGAGTFASLYQLYRSMEEGQSSETGVPFGAVVSIEMGRIFLWTSFGVLSLAVAFFFRAAIRRGRDWIYPAAAAASLVTALVLAFATPTAGSPILLLLGATIFGLGLVQSRSRTAP